MNLFSIIWLLVVQSHDTEYSPWIALPTLLPWSKNKPTSLISQSSVIWTFSLNVCIHFLSLVDRTAVSFCKSTFGQSTEKCLMCPFAHKLYYMDQEKKKPIRNRINWINGEIFFFLVWAVCLCSRFKAHTCSARTNTLEQESLAVLNTLTLLFCLLHKSREPSKLK